MHTLLKDIRYGLRGLMKHPGFTVIAILTLALGIGANTAIFSVVNAVVLRPLPYYEPDRLVMLLGARESNQEQPASFADFNDFKNQTKTLNTIVGVSPLWSFALIGEGEPEQIQGLFASADVFQMLGVVPQYGRVFLPEEDRAGGTPVVIVSHGLWQRRYGADPSLVGKTLNLSGTQATVIGILPAGFQFLEPTAEVWMPLQQNQFATSARNVRLLSMVGRLNPNVKPEQAAAELSTIAGQLAAQYPDTNSNIGLRLVPLHEQTIASVRPALQLLFGAVGLVLLIACANVVNLMLVRGTARRKEIAVRAALGASRLRLIRQLLTESITLSLFGGAGGVLLATWGVKALLAVNPFSLPRANNIGIDAVVLAFTLAASFITGIVFGLAPAWQALKLDLHTTLKEGGRNAAPESGQRRLSNLLVIAEMAMAMVLLIGAGLLIKSFVRLLEVKPGFVTDNILTMQISLPNASYAQAARRIAFMQQLETNLKGLPEVMSVGFVTRLPLMSSLNNVTTFLTIEDRPVPVGERPEIDFRRASPGYFQAMGIPLLSGRLITEQDIANNSGYVLINEVMARRFWPGEDPVGKRISTATSTGQQTQWSTIVGVVGSVRHLGLDVEPRPEIYYHTSSVPPFGPVLVVRTTGDPLRLISGVRAKIREIDPNLPIARVSSMEQLVAQSVAQRRFGMFLLGMFALFAVLLAGVGIYGVMSYSVSQRTQEIGVRMALGARSNDVLRMIVGHGMSLTLFGVGIGLAGAFALTRLMTRLLFQVTPTDALTFASVSLAVIVVALLACYVPAHRATKVDPLVALRDE
jgi:putative ABC transport system permease protein